ncbi:serine carboxypeptidase S28-domain-containing protein [Gautieria morchelliformis]|nr:serine carboxypeptidase S28-domain-containing protein [Gautieria morchelliformis]
MLRLTIFLCVAALVSARRGRDRHPNFPPRPAVPLLPTPDTPLTDRSGAPLPPLNTTYFFDQLIDHAKPSKGTFKQRFWTTWQFYQPDLSIRHISNAASFTGYLTNATIKGLISQANNGSTVVLEHRFFGLSNPIDNLEDESLQLLTIDQAAKDLTYFAKNVHLPQPNGDKINADAVPWILVGSSYSGALTSWTMVDQHGVFWAGYASSAIVEAITDYWAYFEPIRQNMPKNCSADIEAVIMHIDEVFTCGKPQEKQAIKATFGLEDVTHLDDAAGSLRNILWDWQNLQPYVGPNATFFQSCDAIEVKNGVNAPATGWGLNHALSAWGSYFKTVYLPQSSLGALLPRDCLGTYNTSQAFWTNTTIDNVNRSWMLCACNELGYFQEGAPKTWPSPVTRLVQPFSVRQCNQMFPKAFPTPPTPKAVATNAKFKGWNVNLDRVFFANGKRASHWFLLTPSREATVSSDFHHRLSSPSQPIFVGNGFHCSDMVVMASVDPTIKVVMDAGVATLTKWVSQWPRSSYTISALDSAPSPPPFVPLSILGSVASAAPEAVPAVATQATGSPPPNSGGSGQFAIPNAMVRQCGALNCGSIPHFYGVQNVLLCI